MTTDAVSPLRERMIEDMNSRKLGAHTQRGHIYSCKRLAAFLKRSPDTATREDLRLFQLHLAETGMSVCNRNRIMTGVRFLFRVTLRRLDLAAEIYHIREPQKIPQVMSPDETRRLLAAQRCKSLRRLSGTTAQQQVGGLLQAPLRRAQGSVALSRPLHPPRRHLKPPLDRLR
jgi:site-specific recombinase XerD